MQTVKEIVKHYWKREQIEQPWTQPVLSANGTIGGDSFACSALNTDTRTAPYMAFDSNKTNNFTAGWLSKAANNYFEWYSPKALNISKLDIQYMTSNSSAVGYLTSWTIQASNDGETFVDILSGTDGNFGLTTINIQHSGYYKYWKLLPLTWSDEWYCIVNMDITATQLTETITPGTAENYDFYTSEYIYKAVPTVIRHYWKREQTEQPWTQPVLTADGTIGDDSFAVLASAFKSGNETYKAFDNNTSTMWCPVNASNPASHYIIIYNPNALNVSNISVTNRQDTTNPTAVSAGIIYASNNNEEWIEISNFIGNTTAKATWNIDLSLNENYYKYYKFYISSGQYGSSSCGVAEIKLTATQLAETIIPGTADDYDYYTDETIYKGVNI